MLKNICICLVLGKEHGCMMLSLYTLVCGFDERYALVSTDCKIHVHVYVVMSTYISTV